MSNATTSTRSSWARLTTWASSHKPQAAAGAGGIAVAGYALYKKRQAGGAAASGDATANDTAAADQAINDGYQYGSVPYSPDNAGVVGATGGATDFSPLEDWLSSQFDQQNTATQTALDNLNTQIGNELNKPAPPKPKHKPKPAPKKHPPKKKPPVRRHRRVPAKRHPVAKATPPPRRKRVPERRK